MRVVAGDDDGENACRECVLLLLLMDVMGEVAAVGDRLPDAGTDLLRLV